LSVFAVRYGSITELAPLLEEDVDVDEVCWLC